MKLIVSYPGTHEIVDLSGNTNTLVFWARDTLELEAYQNLVNQYGIPEILISEAFPEYSELPHNILYYYCPTYLKYEARQLIDNIIINDQVTEYCFNFMINKKQINRYLLLKLVEWFNLSSYRHTWSGTGQTFDMTRVLDEIDNFKHPLDLNTFRIHMLSPVNKISPHFIHTNLTLDTLVHNDVYSVKKYGVNGWHNAWVWNNVVSDIFSKSAVSLISESVSYEKVIQFTEKTLYSMIGLTFPIWIGGYRQADLWEQHGFDIFNDVINHSYQYRDTLLERCFYAIHDNLQILTDLNYALDKKQQNLARLQHNQKLIKLNTQDICNNSLMKLPEIFKTFIVKNSK